MTGTNLSILHLILWPSQQSYKVGIIIVTLQLRKQTNTKRVKWLAQGHQTETAGVELNTSILISESALCIYTDGAMLPQMNVVQIKNTEYRNKWLWSRRRRQCSKSRHRSTCSNIRGALAATTGVWAFDYDAHSEGPATWADIQRIGVDTKDEGGSKHIEVTNNHDVQNDIYGTEIPILIKKQTMIYIFTHIKNEQKTGVNFQTQ